MTDAPNRDGTAVRRGRPFTAKWHRESERGVLSALDATDEFRAELTQLQAILRQFDNFLLKLYADQSPLVQVYAPNVRDEQIAKEMGAGVRFRIPNNYGGLIEADTKAINACELQVIQNRRSYYAVPENVPDAVGLALSGGGIRSATFSLGVLVALAQRGLCRRLITYPLFLVEDT